MNDDLQQAKTVYCQIVTYLGATKADIKAIAQVLDKTSALSRSTLKT